MRIFVLRAIATGKKYPSPFVFIFVFGWLEVPLLPIFYNGLH